MPFVGCFKFLALQKSDKFFIGEPCLSENTSQCATWNRTFIWHDDTSGRVITPQYYVTACLMMYIKPCFDQRTDTLSNCYQRKFHQT